MFVSFYMHSQHTTHAGMIRSYPNGRKAARPFVERILNDFGTFSTKSRSADVLDLCA
jgi:hypothetical protein